MIHRESRRRPMSNEQTVAGESPENKDLERRHRLLSGPPLQTVIHRVVTKPVHISI